MWASVFANVGDCRAHATAASRSRHESNLVAIFSDGYHYNYIAFWFRHCLKILVCKRAVFCYFPPRRNELQQLDLYSTGYQRLDIGLITARLHLCADRFGEFSIYTIKLYRLQQLFFKNFKYLATFHTIPHLVISNFCRSTRNL